MVLCKFYHYDTFIDDTFLNAFILYKLKKLNFSVFSPHTKLTKELAIIKPTLIKPTKELATYTFHKHYCCKTQQVKKHMKNLHNLIS